jgi:hypothetical protein
VAGRRWTPQELEFLEHNMYRLAAWQIGKRLGRSEAAIFNRARKIGLPRRNPEHLSGNEAMSIIGLNAHATVRRWMRDGLLPAERRPGRGRWETEWTVLEKDVIAFLRSNPHLVDRDKVNPAYQQYVSERWITLGEAFRRGAAHIALLEHSALAGLMPEPLRRRGCMWVIPESTLPFLVAARRKTTTNAEWKRQWTRYARTARVRATAERKHAA